MRILIIAPSAYILGGVQDWLYSLAHGLRSKGYTITVAIPNNRFHDGGLYNEYYKSLNAIYFKNLTGTKQGRINALSSLLVNTPTDLILCVNIGDIYEAYKQVYNQLAPTRIAMTLHAIEGDYLGDIGKYWQFIDGVITTNKLSQKLVRSLGLIDELRVFYAPYGVETDRLLTQKEFDNILRIAWVGRLDNQQKRVFDIKSILANLDKNRTNYILSIAGDGPCREKLESDLDLWIRNKKVRMVGFINKFDLQRFYQKNNILLITSEWETGPIVAWEAMLSGLTVVSSDYIGSTSEGALIDNHTALLFPIGATDIAAKQISRLSNTQLMNKLSMSGREMAMSRYSLESSLRSWEKAIDSVISSKRQRLPTNINYTSIQNGGRLDRVVGPKISEFIRIFLGRKGYCRDPGSEWPHSSYGRTNPKALLEYAKSLEQNA